MNKQLGFSLGVFLAVFANAPGVHAAEPFKNFTFRLVKPPARGTKKLITVQIKPPKATMRQADIISVRPDSQNMNVWFWTRISPSITAVGPGRFIRALQLLASAPKGRAPVAPSLQTLHGLAVTYGTDILLATVGKKISPALILAMIATPSRGQEPVESLAGIGGMMQLTPQIAKRFGVTDLADSFQNIKAGVKYLDWLLRKYDGDPILALAAYDAGEKAVAKYEGVPPFARTRAYVPNVLAAFQVARGLCMTPPELFSDGCAFVLKDQK